MCQEQDMRDTIIRYERWKEDGDIKNLTVEQMADWFIEEEGHPNRCGRCTPDGTLRSGDMEIICPYCNGSGEERTSKPK
jgi:hypothetical protein